MLERRVRDIIEERDQGRWPLIKVMLQLVSFAYGATVRLRSALYERGVLATRRLPCRVVAIGNLTVGGTGKTPMTVYVARQLQQQGKQVAVISRGYKGAAEKSGGVVSDGRRILMGPAQAGDEPYMMAHQLPGIPILVGQDRYRSGWAAIKRFKPDVILLDDGYQHLCLHRDLNILLLDARRPFGNGRLLPCGKLREPVAAAKRADIIVFTRSQGPDVAPALPKAFPKDAPTFHAQHRPAFYRVTPIEEDKTSHIGTPLTPFEPNAIAGHTVYAFSGIADNKGFRHLLESNGLEVVEFQEFADHYQYGKSDIEGIVQSSQTNSARWLATTEKDFYRIPQIDQMVSRLVVVGVHIAFFQGDQAKIHALLIP